MSVKVVSFYDTQNLEEKDINEFDENDGNIQLEVEEDTFVPKPILKRNNPKIKRSRNNLSYDDILNSLGFGVNNMGLYKKNNNEVQKYHQPNFQETQYINRPVQQIQQIQQNNKSLDPRIKNSAIYNKYFKNYKDPNEVKVPQIPLTPQEHRIRLIKQYIETQEAKKRLAQIKSKKMFYSSQNIAISAPQNQNPINLNKLFMFSNRK